VSADLGLPEADAPRGDGNPTALPSILARCDLLEPIPAAGLARLAKHSRIRTFDAGAALVHQGQMSESLFLVVEGKVRAERSHPGLPEARVLATLAAGAVMDEMGVLDRVPQTATVTAQEHTLALVLGEPMRRAQRTRSTPAQRAGAARLPWGKRWRGCQARRR
jgi:CRP/FNR family transcriptional regulator, cyclic AMP receptor protein